MPLDHPESILIVRLSAIGDVVHALPCLHALRERFPDARIGWLVEQLSASLLKGHPEIDDLYVIPKKHWRAAPVRTWLNGEKRRFYGELRRAKWDVAIDFQGLTKSGIPLLFSGAPVRIGFGDKDGREFNKFFTNRRVVPSPERPHVIQRNLSLLEPLGIENPEVAWRFPDFAEERATTDTALTDAGIDSDAGFIALYPGAGWETKRWPTKHFARLSRLLGENPGTADLPQLIIWGPGEEPLCEAILRDAELPEHRLRMAPPTNLRELAALLGRAPTHGRRRHGPRAPRRRPRRSRRGHLRRIRPRAQRPLGQRRHHPRLQRHALHHLLAHRLQPPAPVGMHGNAPSRTGC